MQYYLLTVLSTVLFSLTFVATKAYQKTAGTGVFASSVFRAIVSVISAVAFWASNGFVLHFNSFSFLTAFGCAFVSVGMFVFSTKALKRADLSLYSLFSMLGGMLLPFFYGVACGELMTLPKIFAVIFIVAAIAFSLTREKTADGKKKKIDWFSILCFFAVFTFNGLNGVFTDMHSRYGVNVLNANEFMTWIHIICVGMCLVVTPIAYASEKKKALSIQAETQENVASITGRVVLLILLLAASYAALNGGGNYILAAIAPYIESSSKYPLVTGGCILFSTLFGLFFGERITIKKCVCIALVLIGTVLMTV